MNDSIDSLRHAVTMMENLSIFMEKFNGAIRSSDADLTRALGRTVDCGSDLRFYWCIDLNLPVLPQVYVTLNRGGTWLAELRYAARINLWSLAYEPKMKLPAGRTWFENRMLEMKDIQRIINELYEDARVPSEQGFADLHQSE